MFEIHGIELKLTDCALDEMVARAAKMETGARSLKRVIHATLGRYDRRLPEMAARGVKTLTVTAETVRGEKPAIRTTGIFPKDLALLLQLRKHAGAYAIWKKKPKEENVW